MRSKCNYVANLKQIYFTVTLTSVVLTIPSVVKAWGGNGTAGWEPGPPRIRSSLLDSPSDPCL